MSVQKGWGGYLLHQRYYMWQIQLKKTLLNYQHTKIYYKTRLVIKDVKHRQSYHKNYYLWYA